MRITFILPILLILSACAKQNEYFPSINKSNKAKVNILATQSSGLSIQD